MIIKIVNWEKYNPRSDVKRPHWFRLQNSFWRSPDLFAIDSDGKILWVTLLAQASEKQSGTIKIDLMFLSSMMSITIEKLEATIRYFKDRGMIEVKTKTSRGRNVNVTRTYANVPLHNITLQDQTLPDLTLPDPTIKTIKSARALKAVRDEELINPTELALGRDWLTFALTEMPWKQDDRSWSAEGFAVAIAKVKRATNLNDDGIRTLLEFIQNDDFWRKNATSPAGLLKKSAKNGERKIDNILVRMRTKSDREMDVLKKWAETE